MTHKAVRWVNRLINNQIGALIEHHVFMIQLHLWCAVRKGNVFRGCADVMNQIRIRYEAAAVIIIVQKGHKIIKGEDAMMEASAIHQVAVQRSIAEGGQLNHRQRQIRSPTKLYLLQPPEYLTKGLECVNARNEWLSPMLMELIFQ